MNIEKAIQDNTEAVLANTEVALQLLAAYKGGGTLTVVAPTGVTENETENETEGDAEDAITLAKKAKAEKAAAAKKAKAKKAEAEAEAEAAEDESDEVVTHLDLRKLVKKKFTTGEASERAAVKKRFAEILEECEVESLTGLNPTQTAEVFKLVTAL